MSVVFLRGAFVKDCVWWWQTTSNNGRPPTFGHKVFHEKLTRRGVQMGFRLTPNVRA